MKHVGRIEPIPHGLINAGPLVEVTLAPHSAVAAVLAAKSIGVASLRAKLMIDTGAQRTVIEKSIAEKLGLTPIRFQPVVGVSQKPELCPVYPLSVTLAVSDGVSNASVTFQAEVIGMDSPANPAAHVGLLGRDFLAHLELHYDGPKGEYALSVPQRNVRGATAPLTISTVPNLFAEPGPPTPPETSSRHPTIREEKEAKKAARKAAKESRRRNRK